LHGHCHQKAIATTAGTHATLKLIPDLEVTEIDSGCCGMAGSFGYEAEHYDLSMTIADRVLLPAVRAASEDTLLVANGASCRHQIMDGASRQVRHTIQVLADALKDTDGA
jgi:Fe-S oxidoreductase